MVRSMAGRFLLVGNWMSASPVEATGTREIRSPRTFATGIQSAYYQNGVEQCNSEGHWCQAQLGRKFTCSGALEFGSDTWLMK